MEGQPLGRGDKAGRVDQRAFYGAAVPLPHRSSPSKRALCPVFCWVGQSTGWPAGVWYACALDAEQVYRVPDSPLPLGDRSKRGVTRR